VRYVGSGRFGAVVNGNPDLSQNNSWLIWGRRFRRITRSDIDIIRRQKVIYLDTIDIASCASTRAAKLRWAFSPYRLEKAATFYLLSLFASSVIRLHVPAITDSEAWRRLLAAPSEASIRVQGFQYSQLASLINLVSSVQSPVKRIRAASLLDIARTNGMEIDEISVVANNFSGQLLGGSSCRE